MPEPVPMVRDDVYEDVAMTFQRIQVMELNDALKDCGIEDSALRKEICTRFSFGMGNFLDQYWFKADGKRYYPLLCFAETFLNTDTALGEIGTVLAPSTSFAYHEYAGGDADWYFDEAHEDEGDLEFGVVGDED